jgi:hypothetical protein
MVKRVSVILCLLVAVSFAAAAQNIVDTMTGIFDDRVHTLQIARNDDTRSMPVVYQNSGDKLTISFDRISEDRDYMRYQLIHCNRNWQPSGLVDSEFIDGFNEGYIEDYDFSRATTVHYVHYKFDFPTEQMMPKISGNYLLRVYPESNPDTTWLQCRVMVCEQSVGITADVMTRTDIDYNDKHQQLSFTVNSERADVYDPFNDLTVYVAQNGRYDNEVALQQPLRVSGHTSYYEHQPALIFDAGNEYRRMEIISTNYPGMKVAGIQYLYPYYHFTLETDVSRAADSYLYDQTLSGGFVIREYNSDDSDVEADYAVVHFILDYPETPGLMIFIDGDMVQRRFNPESLMVYSAARHRYERAMLLKQGAYSYQYLAVPSGKNRGYTSVIEGDKYETVNRYDLKVYHRKRGERYDRLIGVATVYSAN